MSRKKKRPSRSSQGSETAIVPKSAVTGLTAAPYKTATAAITAKVDKQQPQERFWLEALIIRLSRLLGSLQLAVLLLMLFAMVLMVGTCVESWYSTRIAQELVYRTWWFTALLAFLWINIFFAAVKKGDFRNIGQPPPGPTKGWWETLKYWWPWKKHQTGFVITHLGLLTMVFGGLLNSLGGTDASLTLIDTGQARYQTKTGLPQVGDSAIDKDLSQIVVKRLKGDKAEQPQVYTFQPGPLVWRADDYIQPQPHPLLDILNWLAHPLPRLWSADLGRGAELEVLAYYPHAIREPYSAAQAGERETIAAVKFALTSPMAGSLPEQWVANRHDPYAYVGPALVEMLGRCPRELLSEFQNPPPAGQLGKQGQLVVRLGDETHRLNVAKFLDEAAQPLGKTGWRLQITRYMANILRKDTGLNSLPENPAVGFDLTAPDGKVTSWFALARYVGEIVPANNNPGNQKAPAVVHVWYHPPDYRWAETDVRAVLQFVAGENDKLYYRSFNSSPGEFQFERTGTVEQVRQRYPIWKGMNWEFQVNEFLPRAVAKDRWVPKDLRPGLEDVAGVSQVVRCRLSVNKDTSEEFWVGRDDRHPETISVGGERFSVAYRMETLPLGFELKLLRAEQGFDPGTQQASSYSSYVQLTDKQQKIEAADRVVTMNEPLQHRGYKFYQSGYRLLNLDPHTLKPISFSTFTVSRDPGIWPKYIGSSMLAIGIFLMFYMKAYFFKPRGRQVSLPPPAASGQTA